MRLLPTIPLALTLVLSPLTFASPTPTTSDEITKTARGLNAVTHSVIAGLGVGIVSTIISGTYYLESVDDMFRRTYSIKA